MLSGKGRRKEEKEERTRAAEARKKSRGSNGFLEVETSGYLV